MYGFAFDLERGKCCVWISKFRFRSIFYTSEGNDEPNARYKKQGMYRDEEQLM